MKNIQCWQVCDLCHSQTKQIETINKIKLSKHE